MWLPSNFPCDHPATYVQQQICKQTQCTPFVYQDRDVGWSHPVADVRLYCKQHVSWQAVAWYHDRQVFAEDPGPHGAKRPTQA